MPRSTEEWVGATDDTPVPPPLTAAELGRGRTMDVQRREELERFCAEALRGGANQGQLCEYLGAGRSRVSRWCVAGLRRRGDQADHRLLRSKNRTLSQMMWARIDLRGPDDCWSWRGVLKSNGYGSLNFRGKTYNAHRLVFETLVCSVPEGLVLDHTCCNSACVNPRHLQPVSQGLNLSLGVMRRAA